MACYLCLRKLQVLFHSNFSKTFLIKEYLEVSLSLSIYIYIYIYHHHHRVMPLPRIFLILSRHLSLSSIAPGRCPGLYPVSVQSCYRALLADRPNHARPCEGVHRSTSFVRSSLLLQQFPVSLVRLIWMVFEMGGWWTYSCCFVGCCLPDLLHSCVIAIKLFSIRLVSVHVVHPYNSTDATAA